jgi:excisionase family DNA binding protein
VPISSNSQAICYSPADAAKALGIGKSTLFALLARSEIRAKKLGTRTLIPASELHRYAESLPEAQFHAHIDERGARHG